MPLTLSFLSPFCLKLGLDSLKISRARNVEGLLIFLVMNVDTSHRRTVLDNLLFPEMGKKQARENLRKTLERLRRKLGSQQVSPSFLVEDEGFTVQFNKASNYQLDVDKFLEGLGGCAKHRQKRDGRCPNCIQKLQDAVDLYRNPFLSDFSLPESTVFEEWVRKVETDLHQKVIDALTCLADYFEGCGAYKEAEKHARRLFELDDLREETHRQLMRLLARQGQRSAALKQYQNCVGLLADELGVEPEPKTEALYQQIQLASEKRPFRLPSLGDTLFIGRKNELRQILQQLYAPKNRLLTLTGPGGIGKTRLALNTAQRVVDDYLGPFLHGVYFVSLATADTQYGRISFIALATAIADVFEISLAATTSPAEQLIKDLQNKECLLVLDNGECLDSAGKALLVDILKKTVGVKFLVTSRERLNLIEESVLIISGLTYPEKQLQENLKISTNVELKNFTAIQLFVERAQRANMNFAWAGTEASEKNSIVHISQSTEGMPLALELAATWIRTLTCQQIAQEIQQNLDILATKQVNFPERHRSIRAVFAHSWQMLTAVEKEALGKLAVFQGTFGRKAAYEIADANLTILASLIDKSLLQSTKTDQVMRYQMHSLLQQFSLEKVEPSILAATREKHADYYGRFLAAQEGRIDGDELPQVLKEIQINLDNIRAGWLWCISTKNLILFSPHIDVMHDFYTIRSWQYEGYALFEQAAVLLDTFTDIIKLNHGQASALACLANRFGELNQTRGDLDKAEYYLERCLTIAYYIEESGEIAYARKQLGSIARHRGNYSIAEQHLQESLQIAQTIADKPKIAIALMTLGAIARDAENYDEAKAYFRACADVYGELGHQWGIGHSLRLLGNSYQLLGQYDQAQKYFQESLPYYNAIDNKLGIGMTRHHMGQIARFKEQYQQSEALLNHAHELFQEIDYTWGLAWTLLELGDLMTDQNRCEDACTYYLAAFGKAAQVQATPFILQTLLGIAKVRFYGCPDSDKRPQIIQALLTVYHHPNSTKSMKEKSTHLLAEMNVSTALQTASVPTIEEIERLVSTLCII